MSYGMRDEADRGFIYLRSSLVGGAGTCRGTSGIGADVVEDIFKIREGEGNDEGIRTLTAIKRVRKSYKKDWRLR